jgi:hypothetical protein
VVKIYIDASWAVTPCSFVVGITVSDVHVASNFTLKMEAA